MPSSRPGDPDAPEYFESFDGLRLAFYQMGAGEPALFLHGFASDSYTNWIRFGVARAAVDSGRRAILLDARGHGSSAKPHTVESYQHHAMSRDASALCEYLGIESTGVVGYSMGAAVAVGLVLHDHRVRSLVLGGAGMGQVTRRDPERAARIADGLLAADKSSIQDPTASAFREFADATKADRAALAAIQRAWVPAATIDELASIHVPTLVVNGERDMLVRDPQSLASAIPSARLQMVPGDHISAVTKPEFARAVSGFLSAGVSG